MGTERGQAGKGPGRVDSCCPGVCGLSGLPALTISGVVSLEQGGAAVLPSPSHFRLDLLGRPRSSLQRAEMLCFLASQFTPDNAAPWSCLSVLWEESNKG